VFGGNTRTALATWVSGQRDRITQIQGEVAQVRKDATTTVDAERVRLAGVVKDIREVQIPALKDRELTMLGKIDDVRQTESPSIATARDEIQRLRESAESQVAQSNILINRLRDQLGDKTNADQIEKDIDEQNERVRTASSEIDRLTEEKIEIDAEYRKLEAEVGPIKYIAEFVYGEEATNNMLEEAVRWVIIIIIFVFDPLAVLLLIASQYTFDYLRRNKDDDGERLRQEEFREYEQARAQAIVDNVPPDNDIPTPPEEEEVEEPKFEDVDQETLDKEFDEEPQKKSIESSEELKNAREEELKQQDEDEEWSTAKQEWKTEHPGMKLKQFKQMYVDGLIDELPWAKYATKKNFISKEGSVQKQNTTTEGYIQNAEQNDESIWKNISKPQK
jgi:hypothetical protein